jgi:hypothetical protein
MLQWIQSQLDESEKLYLLRGRREPIKEKPPAQIACKMRHYLTMVRTQKHRNALTSLLLSTHKLALEILRYSDHGYARVDNRDDRRCRFCKREVESPEHALLDCSASPEVVALREEFMKALFEREPKLERQWWELSSESFLKALLFPRSTIALVAKFAYEILEVFYAEPVYRWQ